VLRINKIVATTSLAILTSGLAVAGTAVSASASTPHAVRAPNVTIIGVATVSPKDNLVDGQQVNVSVSGFPAVDAGQPMYVFQCSQTAVSQQDQAYCDTNLADVHNVTFDATTTNGKATGSTTFNVLEGASFKPTKAAKCDHFHGCYIVVSDSNDPTTANVEFGAITFADSRAKSQTKVQLPKSLPKAGKTLKFKVGVVGIGTATAKGKVKITDNGKTVKKAKVPSSGLIKVTEKHIAKGKHKVTASYGGDKNYQPSKDKASFKIKK